MRFVTKTAEQLNLQALHHVRERLVSQYTGIINQIRAFLLDRGVAVRRSVPPNEALHPITRSSQESAPRESHEASVFTQPMSRRAEMPDFRWFSRLSRVFVALRYLPVLDAIGFTLIQGRQFEGLDCGRMARGEGCRLPAVRKAWAEFFRQEASAKFSRFPTDDRLG